MELPLYRNQLTLNVALGNTFLKLFRENNPFKENHTAAPLRQTDQHRQVHIHISAGCHFLLQSRDTDKYIYLENFNIISSSTFSRNCTLSLLDWWRKSTSWIFLDDTRTHVQTFWPFFYFYYASYKIYQDSSTNDRLIFSVHFVHNYLQS